mgnify:CR=1 FL=1
MTLEAANKPKVAVTQVAAPNPVAQSSLTGPSVEGFCWQTEPSLEG